MTTSSSRRGRSQRRSDGAAVRVICDRHTGVGSDGILLVGRPSGAVAGAVARMRVFNPDGGEPEMCGNGIRIFAKYLVATGQVAGD